MKTVSFFECENQNELLEKIAQADWGAAEFLVKLIREGEFLSMLGGEGDLYLLMDGQNVVSFATLTRQDAVRDEKLYPWIGFVYTYPEYRGNRHGGKLLAFAEEAAARQGHKRVYIATDHVGLYEKYGYHYLENRTDFWGDDSRVLYKDLA